MPDDHQGKRSLTCCCIPHASVMLAQNHCGKRRPNEEAQRQETPRGPDLAILIPGDDHEESRDLCYRAMVILIVDENSASRSSEQTTVQRLSHAAHFRHRESEGRARRLPRVGRAPSSQRDYSVSIANETFHMASNCRLPYPIPRAHVLFSIIIDRISVLIPRLSPSGTTPFASAEGKNNAHRGCHPPPQHKH
jgi:hypothetical protein